MSTWTDDGDLVPLERVAADQRPLVAAFREAGCKSFQDAGSAQQARANYETSCAANGLAPDPVADVTDVAVPGEAGITVRVYDPRTTDETTPVVLFIHGGGWVIGSLETHDSVCRRLVTLTGLPVVAVDYRMGPEHHFPAAHDDCLAALRWVRDQSATRHWDAGQVVTAGDSAGGNLATYLARVAPDEVPRSRVVAQVLLYPAVDMSTESDGYRRIDRGFPLTADSMRWFGEHFFAERSDAADPRVSPLPALRAHPVPQPPAFVATMGLDPLCEEGLEYAQCLALAGTPVELVHLPGHAHGIFTAAGRIPTAGRVLEDAARFIGRCIDLSGDARS